MKNTLIHFLQTFGIILVVMGHCGKDIPYLTTAIYSFHMPLFVFISGFLLFFKGNVFSNVSTLTFHIKKIKRLLIPYILISSIAFVIKTFLSEFSMRPIKLSVTAYIKGLIFPWDNPIIFFWFLPTIFALLILNFLFFKYAPIKNTLTKKYILILISLILHFYPFPEIDFFNISGIFKYQIYFILGGLFVDLKLMHLKIKSNMYFIAIITSIIIAINSIWPVNYSYIRLTIAIIGILFSISLAYIYVDKSKSFLNHLWGYSFSIYLFSWFPQVIIRILGFQVFDIHLGLVWFFSTIFGIYIPFWSVKIIKERKNIPDFVKFVCGI